MDAVTVTCRSKEEVMSREMEWLQIDDAFYETEIPEGFHKRCIQVTRAPHEIRALIPGTIVEVRVRQGQKIIVGQVIITMEAMKMYNNVETDIKGRIAEILVSAGDRVEKDQLLVKIET